MWDFYMTCNWSICLINYSSFHKFDLEKEMIDFFCMTLFGYFILCITSWLLFLCCGWMCLIVFFWTWEREAVSSNRSNWATTGIEAKKGRSTWPYFRWQHSYCSHCKRRDAEEASPGMDTRWGDKVGWRCVKVWSREVVWNQTPLLCIILIPNICWS